MILKLKNKAFFFYPLIKHFNLNKKIYFGINNFLFRFLK
jgi:hypothetical protein